MRRGFVRDRKMFSRCVERRRDGRNAENTSEPIKVILLGATTFIYNLTKGCMIKLSEYFYSKKARLKR